MTMSSVSSEIGRLLGHRYRLLAPVGSGPSAQVFLAQDEELQRQVAVKLLHPELSGDADFLRLFQRELQGAAGLAHPNIVDVYDWGEDAGGGHYLVSEFLGGGSLQGMLDDGWLLSPSQALQIGLEASRALAYAAGLGLAHGDLKPSNLLFTAEGGLRVADFGLSRALKESGWAEPENSVAGLRYAAPELVDGRGPMPRADVYSLAMILTEAVTGEVWAPAADGESVRARDELDALGPVLEEAGAAARSERLDAEGFEEELLEAAQHLHPPGPLPLVGAIVEGAEPGQGAAESVAAATALADTEAGGENDLTAVVPVVEPAVGDEGDGTGASGPVFVPAPVPDPQPAAADPDLEAYQEPSRRSGAVVGALIVLVVLAVVGGGVFLLQRAGNGVNKVPELTGLQLTQAKARVEPYGWEIKEVHTRRDFTKPGQVLRTSPKPGFKLRKGQPLILTVSDGNTLSPVPQDLVGKPRSEAEAALMGLGLKPVVTTQFDEGVAKDAVITLGPSTPSEVPKGDPVTLVVSNGPAPRKVPQGLVGIPVKDAIAALNDVQLEGERQDEFNDAGIPVDQVIKVEPGSDTEVPRDSTVTLTVSKGPTPKAVPDLRGSPLDQAAAQLGQLGFRVMRAPDQPSDTYPAGQVISTNPAAGTALGAASVVTITVSSGQTTVAVPSVAGLGSSQEAITRLTAAGLQPGTITGAANGRPIATSPAAGSQVPRGSRIDVILEGASTTTPPITIAPPPAPTTTAAPPTVPVTPAPPTTRAAIPPR